MENQQVTPVVILDLSAVFKTIDNELLLQALHKKFGLSGSALKWYLIYLKPRRFRVHINRCYSLEKQMDLSVPQGSIQGTFLFMAYASTLPEIIPDSLQLNGYADDHSLRKSFKPGIIHEPMNNTNIDDETCTIAIIEERMLEVKTWMDAECLKLNASKTKFIYFLSRQQLIKICKIWNIRRYLTKEMCHQLVLSLTISHLDYGNAILSGCPDVTIEILHNIQNKAVSFILNKKPRDSATQCLKSLYWLPIWYTIDYKIATLVFKSIHDVAPKYLKELLTEKKISRPGLHSANKSKLLTIRNTTRKIFASKAFSVYGPTVWNNLLGHIRTSPNYNTFKRELQHTYLN